MTNGLGGRKFFFPRIMKEPVERYSPVGAVFDTCDASTHQAEVTTLDALINSWVSVPVGTKAIVNTAAYHAALRQVVMAPACASVVAGIGAPVFDGFLTTHDAAP